jgi:hypothetical protein
MRAMSSQFLTFDRSGLNLRSLTGTSMPMPGIDISGIHQVLGGDLSSDGVADIVVARDDGSYAWFDGQPGGAAPVEHPLALGIAIPALAGLSLISELAGIADANGDGRNDVIFSTWLLQSDTPAGDDGMMHILPYPYGDDGLLAPVSWLVDDPSFTGQPYPGPMPGIAVGEPYGQAPLFPDFDLSAIKVDLTGIPLDVNGEVYIPGRAPLPDGGGTDGERMAEPARQYYGVDTQTGETYLVWDSKNADNQLVAFGNLDGRGGIDVLYQDRTTGTLWLKNEFSDQYFVSDAASNGDVNVAAVGNFNGSADLDEILFYDARTREFSVWVHGPFDPTVLSASVDYFQTVFKMALGWDFAGTGDIDGDGIQDIIIANVGDFAPHLPGSSVPVAYFSSASQSLVDIGAFDHQSLVGIGTFFDGPSIL